MKVAIIHDWLLGMRGGERCLEILCRYFPQVDIYTVFYDPSNISEELNAYKPRASVLQKMPAVKKYYRYLLPFYPIGAFDLGRQIARAHRKEKYDLIISVSHCAAKNVPLPKGVPHVCYCLTPMRYIWDQFDAYFKGRMIEPIAKFAASGLRFWDKLGAKRVTHFVAISDYIRERIKTVYGRDSEVIFPPVRSDWILPARAADKGRSFLCVCALVPYKNVHIIVEAFNRLGEDLVIVGTGPEETRLRKMAKSNVHFVGRVTDEELSSLYRSARAMVFAAEEDFGMTPVEVQAAGRPVIAYGKGGALETVNINEDCKTGVLFPELSASSLCSAIEEFIASEDSYSVENCALQAKKFSIEVFEKSFKSFFSRLGFITE